MICKSCIFVFRRERGSMFWKSDGCTTIKFKNGSVMCSCNHLTHFAILLSPGVEVCAAKNNMRMCISASPSLTRFLQYIKRC